MGCRKWAAGLLAVALLTGALAGCGKGDSGSAGASGPGSGSQAGTENGDSSAQSVGRYVETEEELPELPEGWEIVQMFSAEDKLHLLAVKVEDGKVALQEWERQESGFVDVTREWLASFDLSGVSGDWISVQLLQTGDGAQYLLTGYMEENYMYHLWMGKGEETLEITPEKWTTPNEWGSYEMIQGMAALDDGTLVAVCYNSVDILSGEDGSVLESGQVDGFYNDKIVTDGKSLYLCSSDESSKVIEKWKDGRSDASSVFATPISAWESLHLDVLKDGALIIAGGDGIFRRQEESGDDEWEKLVEGMETDFALSDVWCTDFVALENGCIYGLFQGEAGARLNRYEYDPDAVWEVKEVLKLYTVFEKSVLRQAAILYHKEHPEILITIEGAYPMYYYGETDYNAVYQQLNTMLMGQDAPDILVMDHLNMDSYASKGLLENLDDVVRPLEESGELLSSITASYVQENGKRYVVPLQFGLCMAMGRDIRAENMGTMEALADFLSKADDSYMGPHTVAELVDKFYPYFCNEIVKDKQLDQEALGKYLEYLKAIGDNCGVVSSRDRDEKAYGMWELAAQAKLAFVNVEGFNDCMFPMSMADYIKGDYTAFENRFIPSVQMGICSKSQYVDTAKDFLRFALSAAVQDRDYYSGFPVNKGSLEKQAEADRSNYMAATMIMADDGNYVEFESVAFGKETADRIAGLCGALDKPVREDEKIREVLIESLEGYLSGTGSKEDAIRKIEGGLKMYLAE